MRPGGLCGDGGVVAGELGDDFAGAGISNVLENSRLSTDAASAAGSS
jgi:hypothetical protein